MWITFDVFTVPFSAGAFILPAVVHIFNREKYRGIARFAVLAGFLGHAMVVLVLLMDLGRWDQFYSVLLPWHWNLHSFMLEVSLSMTLLMGVLVLLLIAIFGEGREWLPVQVINQLIVLIAGAGAILSLLDQSSLGSLFLLMSHKLHALWWTPILPVLFFTSALFTGLSVAIFLGVVTWRALGKPAPMKLLTSLARWVVIIQAIYLVLKLGDLLLAGEFGLIFGSGRFSLLFLAEIIIGVIVPLIIFASRGRESEGGLVVGAICTVVGILINRMSIAWFALNAPTGATYSPHWMEWGITIAAVAAAILFYSLAVRYVPVLRETVTEGAH